MTLEEVFAQGRLRVKLEDALGAAIRGRRRVKSKRTETRFLVKLKVTSVPETHLTPIPADYKKCFE